MKVLLKVLYVMTLVHSKSGGDGIICMCSPDDIVGGSACSQDILAVT